MKWDDNASNNGIVGNLFAFVKESTGFVEKLSEDSQDVDINDPDGESKLNCSFIFLEADNAVI